MKVRLVLLALASATGVFGQYIWDYPDNDGNVSPYNYNVMNGSCYTWDEGVNYGIATVFYGTGGSMMFTGTVSGNPNDYEVFSSLSLYQGGETFIHFLRASSTSVQSGSGSYISAEIVVPNNPSHSFPATAQLNINQCVNGVITQLGSTSITVNSGMRFRTVIWGTTLWVFTNSVPYADINLAVAPDVLVWSQQVPSTTGNPGYGGYGMPGSGFDGFFIQMIGHHVTTPPNPIDPQSIATSLLSNQASFKWQPATDPSSGLGVLQYVIYRNSALSAQSPTEPESSDSTVQPATTYTWQIAAQDFHGNISTPVSITLTTPPAQAIDPRRTGVRPSGSYWGGGGEQIDTRSGNLNFSIPLVTPMGRNGWKVPVSLSYNSQNWLQDSGVNWQLGSDVGYGFGWRVEAGSLTPYYAQWAGGVDHYVFTDTTGAEYRLSVNNSGVWSSTESIYVWYDSNANKLHFANGSWWLMGCTSAGTEQDAGTMYPTVIEDANGNQVLFSYMPAAGLNALMTNSSARISGIGDERGGIGMYTFTYNSDSPVPHLTAVSNRAGTIENYTLSYASSALGPPYGSDPNFAGLTTTHLTGVSGLLPYQFTYDTAGASELMEVVFGFGGHLRWTYLSDAYSGSRLLRAVASRFVAADSAGATEWSYGISWDNASSGTVHATMTLADASGIGAKTWNFITSGSAPAWQIGLLSEFVQSASQGGTVMQDDTFTWSQDPALNAYISTKVSVKDPGTSNAQTARTSQTLDQYGNVTQSLVYPYNNTTTPLQTYNSTFLSGSAYVSEYIFNRLVSTTLTMNGTPETLVTNYYDGTCPSPVPQNCNGYPGAMSSGIGSPYPSVYLYDPAGAAPVQSRGLATFSVNPSVSTSNTYYEMGAVYQSVRSDGRTATYNASSSTNYGAPVAISTESYSATVGYNAWFGVTQMTGANGEQMSMTYNGSGGLPLTAVSPYGATTSYSYSFTPPETQTATYSNSQAYTKTTLDGLGRAIRVEKGTIYPQQAISWTDTVYAPCACSPLGKISKVSLPYTPNGTPVWTVYTYDGLGRTVSVQQPDGASTTTTSYSGNQTTVTDPAGKWKQFTSDVLGNLTTVVEPDPANQPSGTLTTSYTYDWMNHVTQVSMTRGSTTQTRTFVYNNAGLLTSATNPENGTVTYTYNSDNTLQYKHDAKGQDTVYSYNSTTKNVTMVQKYPNGKNNAEDVCQRVTYTYGTSPSSTTSPYDSTFTYSNALGRLTSIQYDGGQAQNGCSLDGTPTTFYELYSYHPAGAVTAKELDVWRQGTDDNGDPITLTYPVNVTYTYDTTGAVSSTTYPIVSPDAWVGGGTSQFTYGLDAMGRPVSLTDNVLTSNGFYTKWVQNVQYDYASRVTSLQSLTAIYDSGYGASDTYTTETKSYNVNGQLASLNWSGSSPSLSGGLTYGYSATQNNGQITQVTDTISGETIVYQYDMLKRLTSASSTPNSGSTPTAWTQTFQYDGFGNLTAKVLNGNTASIPVNAATNQLSSAYYDANGNMTSGAGATIAYDVSNRMQSAQETSGGAEYYAYSADNKQIYRLLTNGHEELTFFGAHGEKLGVYSFWSNDYTQGLVPLRSYVYFAGKLIWAEGGAVYQDRVGTNRAMSARFYPFGDEITSTSNDRLKFATYTRDSYTGLDYADQRFYASTYGRFNTPDPYQASGGPSDPGSWNRYSYTRGDPVNRVDPRGLDDCPIYASVPGCDDFSGNPCDVMSAAYDPDDPSACSDYEEGVPAPTSVMVPIIPVATPAPQPVPQCNYGGAVAKPGSLQIVSNNRRNGQQAFVDPITMLFEATGGTGSYTWSVTQYYSASGSITYSNGNTESQNSNGAAQDVIIPGQLTMGQSAAIWTDVPGIWSAGVVSAQVTYNFSTTLSVTSGGMTVNCPTIEWTATVNWQKGSAPTGIATVTGITP